MSTETDKVIIYRGHLEGGNFQCALGLTELGCGQGLKGQRIDGASLQNRFRPNEFKAVLKSMRCSENNNMLSLKIQKPIYIISSLHLDRCVVWQSEDDLKTFLKSLPYKAGKLYAVSATKRRLENRFHLLYPLLGMKNMLLSQFIGIKLFNVGEKQKKQLLYSKFIILLTIRNLGMTPLHYRRFFTPVSTHRLWEYLSHFLSIYFKEASNMTFSNEVFASPL
ncbi:hypothetical protein ACJX0J_037309 [Zea mays]